MEALDGFWNDADFASKVQKEKSLLENIVNNFTNLNDLKDEFEILLEYSKEDPDSGNEAIKAFFNFKNGFDEAERTVLLSGETDSNNAIVAINAGAGGTESCDWAAMLYRMIIKWAESKGFKLALHDIQDGESAGIKSVSFEIIGNYAYGLMKSESGVHRLVRISPFDSAARRHTSFASVYVSPEIDDTIQIEILDKDLRIDVFRSGGAGGQSVNTTDSAVRMTHLPTGIVVNCQQERSQLKNKEKAMKVLRSRLYDLEVAKRKAASDIIESQKSDNSWGAQIRSYVLHPYKLVKDHRNGHESTNPDKVLEGHLDSFMDAYLRWKVSGEKVKDDDNDLD